MDDVIAWISATAANAFIRDTFWVIPAVQTVHILAIAVVTASALLLNLRLVGLIGSGEAKDVFTRRYLPWIWVSLGVLLVSGVILIWGEPDRTLVNPVFWRKVVLIFCAIVLTLVLERPVLRNTHYWDAASKRIVAQILAVAAIACWVSIILAGRWIAYTY